MKAFVTGSTGLLGSNLVRLLLDQGHEVRALARSKGKAEKVLGQHERLSVVVGDMENINAFAPHMQGSEVLFHTAAYFREYYAPGDHWGKLHRINVEGTIRLLDEAEKYGVQKVIYTSSSGVMGRAPDGSPADETTPPDAHVYENLYFKSKVLAEQEIDRWLRSHALPVVLIRPTAMLGPSDTAPTTLGQAIIDLLAGKISVVPPGGFEFVDARDVAQAMINAVERGKRGERYVVSSGYRTMAELVQIIEKVSGIRAPRTRLPFPIMLAVAWLMERSAAMRGQNPRISVVAIRSMRRKRPVTPQKAVRDLGTTFRSIEETVRDEVQWFRLNGYVQQASDPAAALRRREWVGR